MFGQSLIKTIQYSLIEKATGIITGHVQVQHEGVKQLKFPEKAFGELAAVERVLAAEPGVAAFQARIVITGLLSSKVDSGGALIVGIEPHRDSRVTTMHKYLAKGTFFSGKGKEIVMGDSLADSLGLRVGDSVVVMAQAADQSMGADNYRLAGLYHTGSETFDKQIAYVPFRSLQETLAMEGQANNFALRLRDPERLEEVRSRLAAALQGKGLKVVTWREVDEELVGVQTYQNAILKIILAIVFLIVALGILNTIFMSLFERVREFGVLKAIGARPGFLLRLVLVESLLLGTMGGAVGLVAGASLIRYFGAEGLPLPLGEALSYFLPFEPVLFLRFDWPTHRSALGAVVVTSLLAALPPALRAARLKPVECLRHR